MVNTFESIVSPEMPPVPVALSIGSNLGARRHYIERMESLLADCIGSDMRVSCLMETEPLEVAPGQPRYLNRIVCGRYTGTPGELLLSCQSIERRLGRTGKGLRTARTADVDILLYGDHCIASEILTVPHPGVLSRRFCLEGLVQLLPDEVIPRTGRTVREHHTEMSASVKRQCIRYIVPLGDHDEK